jgi:hypothetical protein
VKYQILSLFLILTTKFEESLGKAPGIRNEEMTTSINKSLKHNHIHVLFVTDCTEYLEWQSLLLFHSANMVGHRGKLTRIVCGCDKQRKAILRETYHKLYPNYRLHFAPDFSKVQNQNIGLDCNSMDSILVNLLFL